MNKLFRLAGLVILIAAVGQSQRLPAPATDNTLIEVQSGGTRLARVAAGIIRINAGTGLTGTWNSVTHTFTATTTAGSANTILNGTGAPSSGSGNNGDFYFATDTGCMYGPKAGGVWTGSSPLCLRGQFVGAGAPGSVAGNLPGNTYSDSTNHHLYWCAAVAGTAAPACTAVGVGNWTQADGSGSGNVTGPGSSTNGFTPVWSGTSGTVLGAGFLAENTANKDVASGYAGLDSSAKLKTSEAPTWNQSTTGNAATATALAATPTQCTGGQFATGVAASGNANCSTPSGSGNVSGPGSSTNGFLPQWNGTTGTLLSTGLAVSTSPGANTVPETDSTGVLNVPGGFSSVGPFSSAGQAVALTTGTAGSRPSCTSAAAYLATDTHALTICTNASGSFAWGNPINPSGNLGCFMNSGTAHLECYDSSGNLSSTVAAATATPIVDGTGAVGTSLLYARQDHVHPTDTSRAASNASTTVNGQTCTLGSTCTVKDRPTLSVAISDLAPVVGDSGEILVINPGQAVHLTRVFCAVQGSTNVVVNLDKRAEGTIGTDSGSHLLGSDLTAVTGGANTSTFSNTPCGGTSSCAIAAHAPVVMTFTSVSGTPSTLQCSVDFTVD